METRDKATASGGASDFDFLLGRWQVDNQRLKKRLQGDHDWERFDALQHNQKLPAGLGNYDDFIAVEWRPDFVGLSLRLFSPATRRWSIYWLDNQTAGLGADGALLPPVVGGFIDGVGIFEGDDVLDGRAIRVRYTWCDITAASARWEQAISDDGGVTWEMNWRMLFRRLVQ